jgi:hypothetical protein
MFVSYIGMSLLLASILELGSLGGTSDPLAVFDGGDTPFISFQHVPYVLAGHPSCESG